MMEKKELKQLLKSRIIAHRQAIAVQRQVLFGKSGRYTSDQRERAKFSSEIEFAKMEECKKIAKLAGIELEVSEARKEESEADG